MTFKIPAGDEIAQEMFRQLDAIDIDPDLIDALRYSLHNRLDCDWSKRDEIPFGNPIGDVDESYYAIIRQAGAHIDHKDCVEPFNPDNCCSDPSNHKKVPLAISVITVCTVCEKKII